MTRKTTTEAERAKWVGKYRSGELTARQIAKLSGFSVPAVYLWIAAAKVDRQSPAARLAHLEKKVARIERALLHPSLI